MNGRDLNNDRALWKGWRYYSVNIEDAALESPTEPDAVPRAVYTARCKHETGPVPNDKCKCGLHYIHGSAEFVARFSDWMGPQVPAIVFEAGKMAAIAYVNAREKVMLDNYVPPSSGVTALRAKTLKIRCILIAQKLHQRHPQMKARLQNRYGVYVGVLPELLTGKSASDYLAVVEKQFPAELPRLGG